MNGLGEALGLLSKNLEGNPAIDGIVAGLMIADNYDQSMKVLDHVA